MKPATDLIDRHICAELAANGWCVVPGFLDPSVARTLAIECNRAWDSGDFRRAGVGRGSSLAIREDIRRDHVLWLDPRPATSSPSRSAYLSRLELLRGSINHSLFLGLESFEGHFALYPEGTFYKAHLDRHQQSLDRLVTVILYLNDDWKPGDGGELRLWTNAGEKTGPAQLIEPRLGTLVAFLSGDHWHEVLPARKPRMSVTGWFRRHP